MSNPQFHDVVVSTVVEKTIQPSEPVALGSDELREALIRNGDLPEIVDDKVKTLMDDTKASKEIRLETEAVDATYKDVYQSNIANMEDRQEEFDDYLSKLAGIVDEARKRLAVLLGHTTYDENFLNNAKTKYDETISSVEDMEKSINELLADITNRDSDVFEKHQIYEQRLGQKSDIVAKIRTQISKLEAENPSITPDDAFNNASIMAVNQEMVATKNAFRRFDYNLSDKELELATEHCKELTDDYKKSLALIDAARLEKENLEAELSVSTGNLDDLRRMQAEKQAKARAWLEHKKLAEVSVGDHVENLKNLNNVLHQVNIVRDIQASFEDGSTNLPELHIRWMPSRHISKESNPVSMMEERVMGNACVAAYHALASGNDNVEDLDNVKFFSNFDKSEYQDKILEVFAGFSQIWTSIDNLRDSIDQQTKHNVSNFESKHYRKIVALGDAASRLWQTEQMLADRAVRTDKLLRDRMPLIEDVSRQQENVRQLKEQILNYQTQQAKYEEELRQATMNYQAAAQVRGRMISDYQAAGEENNQELIQEASAHNVDAITEFLLLSDVPGQQAQQGYKYTVPQRSQEFDKISKAEKVFEERSQILTRQIAGLRDAIIAIRLEEHNETQKLNMAINDLAVIDAEIEQLTSAASQKETKGRILAARNTLAAVASDLMALEPKSRIEEKTEQPVATAPTLAEVEAQLATRFVPQTTPKYAQRTTRIDLVKQA